MKNNLKIILSSIGIAILVALMGTATYAYFTLEIEGVGKNNILRTFNKNMEITYTETSNVTLENAYTGDSLTKTFTVANTGNTDVYYNVTLEDVVNNFAKPEELTYRIEEVSGAATNYSTLPTSDATILSDIKIKTGETHSYSLTIKFLSLSTDQSYNMGKTFSGKINVVPSENSSMLMNLKEDSLTYKIMNNSNAVLWVDMQYELVSAFNNETDLRKNIISLSTDLSETNNRLYYTNYSENGRRIFFYKGDNTLGNNVLFGGYCWKIIRTTETAGIKMIYNGVPTNGTCTNATGDAATIGNSVFNTNADYNAYVGYMYGTPNSSTYAEEHKNTNNSAIKTMLENWYANNLLQYNDYIEDTTFCNDRRTRTAPKNIIGNYTTDGFGNSPTLYFGTFSERKYICYSENDKFSVKRKNNIYPIGLIDANEMLLAGITYATGGDGEVLALGSHFSQENNTKLINLASGNVKNIANSTFVSFLSNSDTYWSMTAELFTNDSKILGVSGENYFATMPANTSLGVRPVIALKSNVVVLSGDGSLSSPYKITE